MLVVGSCNGMIRALDRKTGQVRWSYDIRKDGEQSQFQGDPLITDQLVIIGTDGSMGHVYAFERSTGTVRWKFKVAERGVTTDVTRVGQNIYAFTRGDELLCLDLDTGKAKWTFRTGAPLPGSGWTSSPAVTSERAYFGGFDGFVYAVDAKSGKLIWKRDLGARITTSVALVGRDLYVGTDQRRLYRINAESGEVSGSLDTAASPRSRLIASPEGLLVFLGDDILASVDPSLKKVQWSAEASKEWTSARPYFWKALVLAGDRRRLVALRPGDGAREWSREFPETIRGIGVSDEVLFLGSLKGPIFAYVP